MEHSKNKLLPVSKASVDSRWADGLRGIAAVFVVFSHITLCFARGIVPPDWSLDTPTTLFRLPFLRLIVQGNAAVAIFFVLLGFVNSLKPIQLARSGCRKDALSALSNSSFRRTSRLVFPAAAITVISWLLCQLGFLNLAQSSNAFWLVSTTPTQSPSWYQAVKDLLYELLYMWVDGVNKYDQPQWALKPLFHGSMCIYTVLLATANTTPAFRLTAEVILYIWSWAIGDYTVFFNVFAGMILAELAFMLPTHCPSNNRLKESSSYALAVLGLYLCSFPDSFPEQAPWSRTLIDIGNAIFAKDSRQGRSWPGLGAQILCLAILTSPSMRRALSNPSLQWLGGLSYSLYLLHGTLIRTVLTWLVFGPKALTSSLVRNTEISEQPLIPQPSIPVIFIMISIFWVITMAAVHAWSVNVEPWFGTLTAEFEKFAHSWSGSGGRLGRSWSPKRQNGSVLPTSARPD